MNCALVEGRTRNRDISYKYLSQFPDLLELEKGIPYKEFYYHSQKRPKDLEYRILKRITESKEHSEYLVHNCPLTVSLNRYPDILPYKDTLVSLSNHSYINACFIDSTLNGSEGMFIATQAPLRSTMNAFWAMIWEYNVELIVMICCINEAGMKKCEEYFPEEGSVFSENFEISVEETFVPMTSLVQRIFTITEIHTQESKKVKHLHGLAWPDQGAPKIKEEFGSIQFIIDAINNKRSLNPACKIAVHCSAGIGRTGLLIGIYNMVAALEDLIENDINCGGCEARVSVFGTIRRLREQRWGMVNSLKQYRFLYKFMEYWITAHLADQANLI